MSTQAQLALQMIGQLRVLDPSISAEVGTPERKIIDTVAQALAESEVDLNVLNGAFDINSKFGKDLDNFLAIFGFGRQTGTPAAGFVTLSADLASTFDIPIPAGTQFTANNSANAQLIFRTTFDATLAKGTTSVIIPIECINVGSVGNVPANTITAFYSVPPLGVTTVTNEAATVGGTDAESDDLYRTRFRNTVFRNLAGTEDNFLALAVGTTGTTKATVVGPVSRYQEYLQIPNVDDASNDPNTGYPGNGNANEYTTALSGVPNSKYTYGTQPYFVTNGQMGTDIVFYRQDTDFVMNSSPATKLRGDTYRELQLGIGLDPSTNTTAENQPNVTFFNVYSGTDTTVQLPMRSAVVNFQHSYMSSASRNDVDRHIMNCVDVFIDGGDITFADSVLPRPTVMTTNVFTNVSSDRYYKMNFRRVDEPFRVPLLNNIFMPLFFQPMIDLPDQLVVGVVTYYKGVHYWPVQDVTALGGTVRSRNGIEWAVGIFGKGSGDTDPATPTAPLTYTGAKITSNSTPSVEITNYTYDASIINLQVSIEGAKQVGTDALAHRTTLRYFKPDITVMYSPGYTPSDVNLSIVGALNQFFDSQYFGSTIQLSDLLQAIHNVGGVDNVRWSRELLDAYNLSKSLSLGTSDSSGSARDRITECDVSGKPLCNIYIDRLTQGVTGTTSEVQRLYIAGSPTAGSFTLTSGTNTTAAIPYNVTSSALTTALTAASISTSSITGSGTMTDPFFITFPNATGPQNLLVASSTLLSPSTVYNTDFFLADDELPALAEGTLDTNGNSVVSSIITIRPRAQNTWSLI